MKFRLFVKWFCWISPGLIGLTPASRSAGNESGAVP
jgi:hypothetical protein